MTEGPYNLPPGWRWVRLGEVGKVYAGSSAPQDPKYFENGEFPFLRVSDLAPVEGSEIKRTRDYLNDKAKELRLKLAPVGAIVFPKSGAAILTNARAILGIDAFVVSHLAVVEVDNSIAERLWVFRWLQTVDMGAFIENPSYPSLRLGRIKEICIPLPPLDEQRRIVARVEELMEQVREAGRLRQQAREDADRLWQSVLAHSFPTPGSKLPPAWRWVWLGEVANDIQTGFALRKKGAAVGDIVHLRPYNIGDDGELVLTQQFLIPSDALPKGWSELAPGDVLFNNTNSVELVGKTALARTKLRAAFSNHITRIRTNQKRCDGAWLALVLNCLWRQGFFRERCNKWIGQAGYNTKALRNTPIPLPPLDEQRRIVAHLDGVRQKVSALKAAQEETEERLRELEQSILDKAFRGEL